MKHKLLLILFLFPAILFAQNFRGGAFAGLALSQIDGDKHGGYHKPGFIVGASVDRALSEDFALAMELKFIQKGAQASYNYDTGSDDYRVLLNYIQIPLLAKYNVWNSIWAEAGVGFAYLIDWEEEIDYTTMYFSSFKRSEFTFLAGATYDIPTTKLRVGARFSYSLPVRKISDAKVVSFLDKLQLYQYNNNLEFTLCYLFN